MVGRYRDIPLDPQQDTEYLCWQPTGGRLRPARGAGGKRGPKRAATRRAISDAAPLASAGERPDMTARERGWGPASRKNRSPQTDVPAGTLTLMVLRTLDQMGPMHGFGLARRIEQVSGRPTSAQPGHDLPGAPSGSRRTGRSKDAWGVSENNRRARYYAITRTGKRRLAVEEDRWRAASGRS